MKIVMNEQTSLAFNLAAEEYMIRNFKDEIFMLWRAGPSVLLGKNQNAYSEMNMDYVREKNIQVVRRMSGGGAVYNDLGNTNFCFIMNDNTKVLTDFTRFTTPIIQVLKNLGVDAAFTGRNDMTIQGKKFSGNAQYRIKKRILHHGTLLFSSDIFDLSQSLNPSPTKFSDKAVKSVKSRVTNIKDHLKDPAMDIHTFREIINRHIMTLYPDATYYTFTDQDIEAIETLMQEKYLSWEWNFGTSPSFNLMKQQKFPGGVVEVYADIKDARIANIQFHGDFFGHLEVTDLEKLLIGKPYDKNTLELILRDLDVDAYFKNISADEILKVIFE
ncbi:MAG: lipoate--protein ligase [delta proteobacterium ML8_F1]|nr:MAG: lipoate--protein ligase [delta proteobacterium ML8_F1]